jgi:hypothetical protein
MFDDSDSGVEFPAKQKINLMVARALFLLLSLLLYGAFDVGIGWRHLWPRQWQRLRQCGVTSL